MRVQLKLDEIATPPEISHEIRHPDENVGSSVLDPVLCSAVQHGCADGGCCRLFEYELGCGQLPNGLPIYVRLFSHFNGSWAQYKDYVLNPEAAATLTSPTLGALAAANQTFTWAPVTGATGYTFTWARVQVGATCWTRTPRQPPSSPASYPPTARQFTLASGPTSTASGSSTTTPLRRSNINGFSNAAVTLRGVAARSGKKKKGTHQMRGKTKTHHRRETQILKICY